MKLSPFIVAIACASKQVTSFTSPCQPQSHPTTRTLSSPSISLPFSTHNTARSPTQSSPSLSSSSSSSSSQSDNPNNPNNPRSHNEFSRPYRTEIILGARRKEYSTQFSATESELSLLADRFSLSEISRLDADVVFLRDPSLGDRNAGMGGGGLVRVRGDVHASVKQTCVRTNEDFEVDLEFGLNCVVRSCSRWSFGGGGGGGGEVDTPEETYPQKKKKGKKRRGNLATNGQLLDQMTTGEIDDFMLGEDEEVVEDPAILGDDGVLDAGELVAQSFRIKLDPFPKKPGTEPVSYSITG